MNALRLRIAMLLTFNFRFFFLFIRKGRIEIDLCEFTDQIRENECLRLVWIQEAASLFRKISLMRFLIDGEKKFLLQGKKLVLPRVLIELQLGFIDRLALLRILHHAKEKFVSWLTELHFEHH